MKKGGVVNARKIVNRQIKLMVALVVLVLVGARLLSQLGKRTETAAEALPGSSDSVANFIEKVQETLVSSNTAPAVVALAPTVVRRASVAMVPPQVREAEDATAKVETLPQAGGYEAMLAEVSALGEKLSDKQIADLYGFLKRPLYQFKGMDAPSVASLKNQVMDRLLEQKTLPDDYGAEMIGLYRNRANDELLRNFAVQHLDLYNIETNFDISITKPPRPGTFSNTGRGVFRGFGSIRVRGLKRSWILLAGWGGMTIGSARAVMPRRRRFRRSSSCPGP